MYTLPLQFGVCSLLALYLAYDWRGYRPWQAGAAIVSIVCAGPPSVYYLSDDVRGDSFMVWTLLASEAVFAREHIAWLKAQHAKWLSERMKSWERPLDDRI